MSSPELVGSPLKRLNKDLREAAHAITLFVVEQFCWKKSEKYNG